MVKPSPYQLAIFEHIKERRGNLVVKATAGSGKTTTIKRCTKFITGNGLFLAHNKHIADELRPQVAPLDCKTLHSFGMGAVMRAFGRPEVREYKGYEIARRMRDQLIKLNDINDGDDFSWFVNLLNYARATLWDESRNGLAQMVYSGEVTLPKTAMYELGKTAVMLKAAVKNCEYEAREMGVIDFTDMIWLPVRLNLPVRSYDWVFIDEAQDLNPCQLQLLLRIDSGKTTFVAVGDQCQPEGTMVKVIKPGHKNQRKVCYDAPIEDLEVGDEVIAYDRSNLFFPRAKVSGITKRPYEGDLIRVSMSDGKTSAYTPNHICIASFNSLRGKHFLYLMRKGQSYRIGITKFYDGCNTPLVQRMKSENAEAIWVLDVFETREQAYVGEQVYGSRFGIPQAVFNPESANMSEAGCKAIHDIWALVGDNSHNAKECLEFFHRDINYPLFIDREDGKQQSMRRPFELRACNLLNGCLMLPVKTHDIKGSTEPGQHGVPHNSDKSDWVPVSITREKYVGYVYSLDVEKYHTYVADGIATHNCQSMYSFAGADNDSIPKIIAATDATVLPLSVCYRCPKTHIELAKEYTDAIEPAPQAIDGQIINIADDDIPLHVKPGDLVLSRLTAPLISLCLELIRVKIPARVKGRDIGKGLIKQINEIANSQPQFDFANFSLYITEYYEEAAESMRGVEFQSRLMALQDRLASVRAVYESSNARTISDLNNAVDALFNQTGLCVELSTIHKAKGLENDRVFVLHPNDMPRRWDGQTKTQLQQERNILFVALTRAKQALYMVYDPEYMSEPAAPSESEIHEALAEHLAQARREEELVLAYSFDSARSQSQIDYYAEEAF